MRLALQIDYAGWIVRINGRCIRRLVRTGYWRMKSVDGLTSEGYCLADSGHEYIVFLNVAKPFTLKLEGLAQPLKAQWYQPFTGLWQDAGSLDNGVTELKPPAEWPEGPVAIHIGTPNS